MNRRLLASIVGIGVVGIAPWAHGQTPKTATPAAPSSAAFAPPSAAPAATPAPAAAPGPAPAPAAPAPAPAPAAGPAPAAAEPLPEAPEAPAAAAAPAVAPAPTPAPAATRPASPLADPPEDEAEPGSGLALVIVGWIASGVGAANLALIPTCSIEDIYPKQLDRDVCVGVHVGFGVVGLGVGIPMLAVGYHKRSKYKEWKERHSVLDGLLHTQVAIQNDSALLVYHGTF